MSTDGRQPDYRILERVVHWRNARFSSVNRGGWRQRALHVARVQTTEVGRFSLIPALPFKSTPDSKLMQPVQVSRPGGHYAGDNRHDKIDN